MLTLSDLLGLFAPLGSILALLFGALLGLRVLGHLYRSIRDLNALSDARRADHTADDTIAALERGDYGKYYKCARCGAVIKDKCDCYRRSSYV